MANVSRNCSSYFLQGNQVIFHLTDSAGLQLQLCSQSVVKIWFSPDGNFQRKSSSFAVINEQLESIDTIRVEEQPACYELFTSKLRIRVNKKPCSLQIFDKYQKLIFSDYADKGHVSEGSKKIEYKTLRRDEHFFGLGEKTGKMDRRGEAYKMWNSDKPCYSIAEDPLYKSIPFFMSSYHYGLFLDNTYKTEFKFGTESRDYYSFEAPDGEMVYYFIFGKDYKEIMGEYVELTGKAIMPPKWALGFAQCRGLLTNEKLTRDIAKGYRNRGIPCDIIYQDIGWTQNLQDFEWRKGNYENPRKMLSDLKEMGFKVIVSQDPVISQANEKQWKEADAMGYFVKDSVTGESYDMPWPWGGNCGVVDFTLPKVADWWGAYQQKPIDDGVAGFWTDMGEPAWSNEDQTERLVMKHHLGMHDEIHNVYGLTWDKVVKEQFEKRNPDRRVFQMTRAAYAGLQRYTFGWTGDSGNGNDVLQGWGQLANQIPVTLSAGLGLIPFVTCDITGYCGDIEDYPAMAELYTRWIQFGAFNPLSRIHHEGDVAVEPWLFGAEAEQNAKAAIELKYRLMPYIYTYAREAHDKGLPIMRPMFMEYPLDAETVGTDAQFMFGKELLVAPVVKKGARTKNVYLPEGKWINYNNKQTVLNGEQWTTVDAPLNVIPMFVKQGSIIPTMPVLNYTNEREVYPITFEVFPAQEGEIAQFSLYEDEGEDLGYQRDEFMKTPISFQTLAKRYELTLFAREGKGYQTPGKRNFVFAVYTSAVPKQITMDGKKLKKVKVAVFNESIEGNTESITWTWDKEAHVCKVKLPDVGVQKQVLINY
nr:TIM-barrel domain-containing protein [Bacteroides ihuae]